MTTPTPWAKTYFPLDQIYGPSSMAYDHSAGLVWTARAGTHDLPPHLVFDSRLVESWTGVGAIYQGALTLPNDYGAIDAYGGALYITQPGGVGQGLIHRLDPSSGDVLATYTVPAAADGASGVRSIYAHASGLYVTMDVPEDDQSTLWLARLSADLSTTHYAFKLDDVAEPEPGYATTTWGLTVDGDGNAYTVNGHRLYRVTPTGTKTAFDLGGLDLQSTLESLTYVPLTIGPLTVIAADATNDRYTRSDGGNFSLDGLVAGQTVLVEGFSDPANNGLHVVFNVSADNFRVEEALVDEAAGAAITMTGDSLLLSAYDQDGTAHVLVRWDLHADAVLATYGAPANLSVDHEGLRRQGALGKVWLWSFAASDWPYVEFDVYHMTVLRTLPADDTWGATPYRAFVHEVCSPAIWQAREVPEIGAGNQGLYKLTLPDDAPAEDCPVAEAGVTQVPIERVSGAPVSGVTQLVVECVSLSGAPARVSQLAVELVRDNVAEPPPEPPGDPAARPRRAFVTT